MKATKDDFVRVQDALLALCGSPAGYDTHIKRWRPPMLWVQRWHGVPHAQISQAVRELLTWLDLRFPRGVP